MSKFDETTPKVANDAEKNKSSALVIYDPDNTSVGQAIGVNAVLRRVNLSQLVSQAELATAIAGLGGSTIPVLSISGEINQSEGQSGTTNFIYTVTRVGDLSGVSSADWAVTGAGNAPANAADFVGGVLPTGTVSFAADESFQTITVPVQGDASVEGNENFDVMLSNFTNATSVNSTSSGVILADDAAGATIISGPITTVLSPTSIQIRTIWSKPVQLSTEWGTTTSYGNAGPNETTLNFFDHTQTVTGLPAGTLIHFRQTSTDVDSNVVQTADFTETTTAVSGDPIINMTAGVAVLEGNAGTTPFVFVLSRTGNTAGTSTADWAVTATGGTPASAADFVGGSFPTGTVSFAGGEASQTITVNVQGDTNATEATETFLVTLSNPSAGTTIGQATAIGTITDDDSASLQYPPTKPPTMIGQESGMPVYAATDFPLWDGTVAPLADFDNFDDNFFFPTPLHPTQTRVIDLSAAHYVWQQWATPGNNSISPSNIVISMQLPSDTDFIIRSPLGPLPCALHIKGGRQIRCVGLQFDPVTPALYGNAQTGAVGTVLNDDNGSTTLNVHKRLPYNVLLALIEPKLAVIEGMLARPTGFNIDTINSSATRVRTEIKNNKLNWNGWLLNSRLHGCWDSNRIHADCWHHNYGFHTHYAHNVTYYTSAANAYVHQRDGGLQSDYTPNLSAGTAAFIRKGNIRKNTVDGGAGGGWLFNINGPQSNSIWAGTNTGAYRAWELYIGTWGGVRYHGMSLDEKVWAGDDPGGLVGGEIAMVGLKYGDPPGGDYALANKTGVAYGLQTRFA